MKRKSIVIILIAINCINYLHAQQVVDSIYNKAIEYSKQNEYDKAIQLAKKALRENDNRTDISVFIANVYSWKNNNDTSMMYLDEARKKKYINDDFYETALNVLLRAQKIDSLIKVCNEAEAFGYKNAKDLTLKRLIAYDNKKEYEKIVELASKKSNKIFSDDKIFIDIVSRAKGFYSRNLIAVDYSIDIFQNQPAHHYFAAAYTNKVKNITTTIGFNYAARFGKNDLQLEYTGYKTLKSSNYWYLNYGYAFGNELFPKHRAGLEYYLKLSKHWDTSFGGRYMFYPLSMNKNIFIVTGNVGVYHNNTWLTIRPFFVLRQSDKSISVSAKYRIYASNPANFWGLELGFGNSPDDIYTVSQGAFNKLMSYRYKLEKNIVLSNKSQLFTAAGYVYEEYASGLTIAKRNRFIIDIGYRVRF